MTMQTPLRMTPYTDHVQEAWLWHHTEAVAGSDEGCSLKKGLSCVCIQSDGMKEFLLGPTFKKE